MLRSKFGNDKRLLLKTSLDKLVQGQMNAAQGQLQYCACHRDEYRLDCDIRVLNDAAFILSRLLLKIIKVYSQEKRINNDDNI